MQVEYCKINKNFEKNYVFGGFFVMKFMVSCLNGLGLTVSDRNT